MLLKDAKIGSSYVVGSFDLDQAVMKRLNALGMTRGTRIKLLNRNNGGSVIILVRGSRLALGRLISQAIILKEETNERGAAGRLYR